jgi:hypothetical protein
MIDIRGEGVAHMRERGLTSEKPFFMSVTILFKMSMTEAVPRGRGKPQGCIYHIE